MMNDEQDEDVSADAPQLLALYRQRGFRLLYYPTKTKGPFGPEAVGWTTRDDAPEAYESGQNVGIFTGVEVQPGKFLVDVDFDWADGLALRKLLPPTAFGFGRATRLISHALFTSPTPLPSKEYADLNGKNFVELRGTKGDGTVGLQTMAPPSIHPNGEAVVLRMSGEIGHADNLQRRITLYAIGCMLLSRLGQKGLMHEARLAVAGFLLAEGLEEEEVIEVGQAVAEASQNNVADVATAVRSTATKLRNGEHVAGRSALARALGPDGKQVCSRIKEWLGNTDFHSSNDKIIANNQENIERALEQLNVTLTFDSFAQRLLVSYNEYTGQLTDQVRNDIWLDIERQFHFRPAADYFDIVLQHLCYKSTFHPVLDYLKAQTWDKTPRLDTWLIRTAAAHDCPYTRAISALPLIAAVRRLLSPGAKFDELLVLESSQGWNKSTALKTLCPNEDWFSDDLPLDVDAKQLIERTQGKWIIEASDLSGMGKARVEHLKAMLSRQVDGPVRLAYARFPIDKPRQFILIGTTNAHIYLDDTTGNRRFWPLRIERVDLPTLRAMRDQLWAEAYERCVAGESIRLSPDLYEYAGLQQERRRTDDPWEDRLLRRFDEDYQRVTPDEVWESIGVPVERRDSRGQRRVNDILQRLGFRRMSVKDDAGKVVKGWGRGKGQRDPKLPMDEPKTEL